MTAPGVRPACWRSLTLSRDKYHLFTGDPYFRSGFASAEASFGASLIRDMQRLGLVVIRPEAIVQRRIDLAIDYLLAHGFSPLRTQSLSIGWSVLNEIWRYQTNLYTTDSLMLQSLLLRMTDSLLIIVRDDRPADVPGCVRLAQLKGSSLRRGLKTESLRALLCSEDIVLKGVHMADEPIELIREAGLYAGSEIDAFWAAIIADLRRSAQEGQRLVRGQISEFSEGCPQRRLNPQESLSRAAEVIRRARPGDRGLAADPRAEVVLDALDGRSHQSAVVKLSDLRRLLLERPNPLPMWDFILVAARLIQHARGSNPASSHRAQFRQAFELLETQEVSLHLGRIRGMTWHRAEGSLMAAPSPEQASPRA